MDLFFPEEGLLRFIFSWGRPLDIYFFLGKAFQDLFFPGEGPPRFFFFSISSGPPPRSLMVVPEGPFCSSDPWTKCNIYGVKTQGIMLHVPSLILS